MVCYASTCLCLACLCLHCLCLRRPQIELQPVNAFLKCIWAQICCWPSLADRKRFCRQSLGPFLEFIFLWVGCIHCISLTANENTLDGESESQTPFWAPYRKRLPNGWKSKTLNLMPGIWPITDYLRISGSDSEGDSLKETLWKRSSERDSERDSEIDPLSLP